MEEGGLFYMYTYMHVPSISDSPAKRYMDFEPHGESGLIELAGSHMKDTHIHVHSHTHMMWLLKLRQFQGLPTPPFCPPITLL